jgi:transposase-like protein
MKYNSHEKLRTVGKKENSIVTKGRKTTFEERVSIVEDCIANGRDYTATAVKFDVSYQQVYTWVRKHDRNGIEGLRDGRGHRKSESEMSELERLRYENRMLKAQLTQQQMEIDFLKKLEELERR